MTPAGRTLAERLAALHNETGLTGAEFAVRLGWGEAKRPRVSRIRNGTVRPTQDEVEQWAAAAGHPGQARELLDLLADAEHRHRQWRGQLRRGNAPVQDEWDQRVRAAARYRTMSLVIPGLLQTLPYARAILGQVARIWGAADLEAAVAARMRRQLVLYEAKPVFEMVTTEAALRMPPVSRPVMADQLDQMLLTLDAAPNLTLGIIPLGVPLTQSPTTAFTLLDDQAIVETTGGEDTPGAEESAGYAAVFGELMAEAVTGDEARRLITAAAAGLRG